MIVSIDGAIGQGKSEVLSAFQEESYSVTFLPKTRAMSIDDFCSSQDDLLNYRLDCIKDAREKKIDMVLESSFVDMFIYSMIVIGFNYEYSKWLDSYYDKCAEAQSNIDYVILLPLTEVDDLSMSVHTAKTFYTMSKILHAHLGLTEVYHTMGKITGIDRITYINEYLQSRARTND